VYSPFNILRAMDFAGGTLSYEGIEVLRSCEVLDRLYYRGSVIPCTADLKRIASSVNDFGNEYCPFLLQSTKYGEMFTFEFEKAIPMIVQAHKLDHVAKHWSIEVCRSIDGADITKSLSMVAAGIKIIDKSACCPISKKPFILDNGQGDSLSISGFQSQNNCFPLMLAICKETKETFPFFEDLFMFLDNCSNESTNPLKAHDYKALQCYTNCDMAAQWRGLAKGGGMKVKEFPCHCCSITDDALLVPNEVLCARWCQDVHDINNPSWKCYHKSIEDDSNLVHWNNELTRLSGELHLELDLILQESKITNKHSTNDSTDQASIFYEPTNQHELDKFAMLLTDELILREMDVSGDWIA